MLEKEKLDAVFVETTTHARVLAMTHADVETGHRATTLCHRVNLCRTMQRTLRWDPKKERFTGDEEADRLLSRPRRRWPTLREYNNG